MSSAQSAGDAALFDHARTLLAKGHAQCLHFSGGATRDELQLGFAIYEEVRAIGVRLHDRRKKMALEADVQGRLGNVRSSLGEFEAAADHYSTAIAIWQDLGDTAGVLSPKMNLGNVLRCLGQHARAVEHLEPVVAQYHELGDTEAERKALTFLAGTHRSGGQHAKALEVHLQHASLDGAGRRGNATRWMEQLYMSQTVRLAELRSRPELNGQIGTITAFRTDAARVCVTIESGASISVKPTNLIFDSVPAPQLAPADPAVEEALRRAEALGKRGQNILQQGPEHAQDALRVFEACHVEACMAINMSSPDDQCNRQAMEMDADSLTYICMACGCLNLWARASEAAQLALTTFQALGNVGGEAKAQQMIQMLALRPADTHEDSQQAAGRTSLGARASTEALLEEADTHADQGAFDRAQAIYRQVADTTDNMEVRKAAMGKLASVYTQMKDHANAAETLCEVVAICMSVGHEKSESLAHLQLAQAYVCLSAHEEAATHFESALELSRKNSRPGMEAKVHCGMGSMLREQGNYSEVRQPTK